MRYCFDIDGTICSTDCHYEDAKPYSEVIKKINRLYNSGNIIILYTSRGSGSGTDWSDFTKKQVDSWGVKYHDLKFGKPPFDLYVCDKSINSEVFFGEEDV